MNLEQIYVETFRRLYGVPENTPVMVDQMALAFGHELMRRHRETLRPFAVAAILRGPHASDEVEIVEGVISLGDLRRAYRDYYHVD